MTDVFLPVPRTPQLCLLTFLHSILLAYWLLFCTSQVGVLQIDEIFFPSFPFSFMSPRTYTLHQQRAVSHFCFAALSNQILWESKDHRQESITVSVLKTGHGKTATKALFIALLCLNTQHLCCLAVRAWCWDLTQHWKQGVLFLTQTLVHSVT